MSSFRKNFSKLASGALIAQIIALLSSPIITRLYTPDDYGVFGLYIAISTILIMVSTGRYHLAIVLPKDDTDAITVVALSAIIVFLFALLSSILILLYGDKIASLLNSSEIAYYLWVIPFSIIFRGLFVTTTFWSTRQKSFGRTAIANITESATGASATILSGLLFGSSVYGLILSRLLSAVISLGTLLRTTFSTQHLNLLKSLSIKRIFLSARYYKKFLLISSWASILNTIAFMGPVILLSIYFTPVIVGLYTIADRVLITPLSMISNSLSQVVYQKYSSNHNTNISSTRFISLVGEKLFSIALFPFILVGLFGEDMFSIIFGQAWAEAGKIAQFLSLYAFSRFVSAPLMNICHTLNKQEAELYFNIALSTSRIASIVIGGITQDIYLGFILLSVSSMVTYFSLLFFIFYISHIPIAGYMKYSAKIIIYTLPLFILSIALKFTYKEWEHQTLILFSFIIFSTAFYYFALLRVDRDFISIYRNEKQ